MLSFRALKVIATQPPNALLSKDIAQCIMHCSRLISIVLLNEEDNKHSGMGNKVLMAGAVGVEPTIS